jgi:ABC-type Fe3+/spermidine/putrescine transport system ATPase subunit
VTNTNDRIVVEHLSKSFGSREVLSDVSFTVKDQEFLSILGPSGCGKSTILRILIGLIEPTSGKVFKNGVDITNFPPAARKMGIVFQNYALFENMTVLGNVEYALKMDKTKKADSRRIALELIERVGLSEHLNKRPYKLSGGQQQRVAIARTLAVNPDVILLDEPMSALDADMRLSLRHELKSIQKEFGSTMVYITHDQEEALAMSDRIIVMDAGVIRQLDTPQNIVEHPADDYVQSFVLDNMKLKMVSLAGFNIA